MALGFAASLARPGGNVTGVASLTAELDAKRLHMLYEAMPGVRRVAGLFPARSTSLNASEPEMRRVAAASGIELIVVTVDGPDDYKAGFARMRASAAEALVITSYAQFNRDMEALATLALSQRLPTVCPWADNAEDGCLLGYGPNFSALRGRLVEQVVRIFGGAMPADLPIEQPAVFELAVNLKTAKALGVTLPELIFVLADELIE